MCRIKSNFASFLVSYVFTLKMHIYDLEKFRRTSAHILTWPNFSFDLPLLPCKAVFPVSLGLFFYRLRHPGTFHF